MNVTFEFRGGADRELVLQLDIPQHERDIDTLGHYYVCIFNQDGTRLDGKEMHHFKLTDYVKGAANDANWTTITRSWPSERPHRHQLNILYKNRLIHSQAADLKL